MNTPNWKDMASAYALGALPADERAAFERRLAVDAELRAEVAEYERLVGELGRLAAEETPPARLRERILAGATARGPGQGTGIQPRTPRRGAIPKWVPWGLAAAGLVLSYGLWNGQQDLARQRAGLAADYERALDELAAADSSLAARDSLLAILRAGGLGMASLAGPEGGPAARVYYDSAGGQFAVLAFDLPAVPAGRVYQLWAISEGLDPVSVGTFDVANGAATLRIPASAEVRALPGIDLAAVTVEPAGGSPQPTETPRYLGAWRSAEGAVE